MKIYFLLLIFCSFFIETEAEVNNDTLEYIVSKNNNLFGDKTVSEYKLKLKLIEEIDNTKIYRWTVTNITKDEYLSLLEIVKKLEAIIQVNSQSDIEILNWDKILSNNQKELDKYFSVNSVSDKIKNRLYHNSQSKEILTNHYFKDIECFFEFNNIESKVKLPTEMVYNVNIGDNPKTVKVTKQIFQTKKKIKKDEVGYNSIENYNEKQFTEMMYDLTNDHNLRSLGVKFNRQIKSRSIYKKVDNILRYYKKEIINSITSLNNTQEEIIIKLVTSK
ncbi:hypothetical protein MY04_4336 [Flammeovirga sp. MY04]|uniref:hypothetical protein n=1 Tax=Flammeovirga sp. MY04 TaxID=1191459 RepID=UPI00080644B2|nr:hypothetical protein [Flammeovirga sp. MY04]ANQ51676.1 hypothetical protein MY04_4336 [Flammeovirga sp. MY04]